MIQQVVQSLMVNVRVLVRKLPIHLLSLRLVEIVRQHVKWLVFA